MATLILGALEEEIAACRERLSHRRDSRWREFSLSEGRLGDSRVAVARTGVGKTMAALAAQHWIDALQPERLLFIGTAGAVVSELDVGDLIVAAETLQYDLDARPAGFEVGRVPLTDYRFIESDPALIAAALSYRPDGFRIAKGRVLTGDRLVARSTEEAFSQLFRELGGMAVEMEGASVALVCRVNGVPFLLVRFVSDRADGGARRDFRRLLPIASSRLLDLVEHVLAVVDEG